jgi:hypothetical protein
MKSQRVFDTTDEREYLIIEYNTTFIEFETMYLLKSLKFFPILHFLVAFFLYLKH